LGEDVPSGGGCGESLEQPITLASAQQGGIWTEAFWTGRLEAVATGLICPILAGIEDKEAGERTPLDATVKLETRTGGGLSPPEGHVFVVGLVGVGPATEEIDGFDVGFFGDGIGVIVVDLMIIPGDAPRGGGVHGLEGGIGSVESVTVAVLGEGFDFGAEVLSDATGDGRAFVDVIAEVDDEVDVIGEHVVVGGKEAGFEVLAGSKGEAEELDGFAWGWGGS
jgi:hypothetical protein